MNSIDLTPLYRSSIGFDRLASLIDSALRSEPNSAGYPPYNIEALEDNRYAITLAVAGFSRDELEIKVEDAVLSIRGNKQQSGERRYLHQGIANRSFERKFNLADYVEVTGAELDNGLLTIKLVKEIPEEMKPRTISISQGSNVIEHQSQAEEQPQSNKTDSPQAA